MFYKNTENNYVNDIDKEAKKIAIDQNINDGIHKYRKQKAFIIF